MNANERELDREAGADGPEPATFTEIVNSIIVRNACTATETEPPSILKLAEQLAEILESYGLSYSDLYNGMREPRRQQYDPT